MSYGASVVFCRKLTFCKSRAMLNYLQSSIKVALHLFWHSIHTVDQLMWRTIVHHIPRWREPSPLRDFMIRLWLFTLWNVDFLHANRLIRCVWIAAGVVFMENNAHPVCIVDDEIPLGCGGQQTRVARMMWWTIIWDVGDDICPWMYLIL